MATIFEKDPRSSAAARRLSLRLSSRVRGGVAETRRSRRVPGPTTTDHDHHEGGWEKTAVTAFAKAPDPR